MAKRTAIIDIGSNSARMVVFERTSRFGFHLLREAKSPVRISEGAFEHGGLLQPAAMQRAEEVLGDFLTIARALKVRKILCVATAAVRNAPNKSEFVARIRQRHKLSIKVIDGKKEAWLGALASVNLLPITDGITVDIGGGSTELALIEKGEIKETISLEIGTVRLKELFVDRGAGIKKIEKAIAEELSRLPESFRSKTLISIGGTGRAIAQAIMTTEHYPIDTLHGFTYNLQEWLRFIDKIIHTPVAKLKELGIKEERHDVIREGAMIFRAVIEQTGAQQVIASGVGVREGVFLSDLLRGCGLRFPVNFNPSVRSLRDRFDQTPLITNAVVKTALALFDTLAPIHKINPLYRRYLDIATKLSKIGIALSYYNKSSHAWYFIINNLNYGFTHAEKLLIANILKLSRKKEMKKMMLTAGEKALLPLPTLKWLSYLYSLAAALHADYSRESCRLKLEGDQLTIILPRNSAIVRQSVARLYHPYPFTITLVTDAH
ncbi:MAG: Ppx/GppA family phosphatase [Campylobacterales bacterium]